MEKPTSPKLKAIKVARALVYLVYAWLIIATVFLFLGFILLLFGANPSSSFVSFVYRIAADFLEPFRGMFPPHQISDTAYFSSAALFAVIFYSIIAVFIHSLIEYITVKLQKNELELQREYYETNLAMKSQSPRQPAARKPAATGTTRQVR